MKDTNSNPLQPASKAELADILGQVQEKLPEFIALLDLLRRAASATGLAGDDRGPHPMSADSCTPSADTNAVCLTAEAGGPCSLGRQTGLRKHDMQAYQLWHFDYEGLRQADVARKLNEEHGTTYSQGQISRMIHRARVRMKVTGLVPAGEPAKPARSVNPQALDLGQRTDGRRTDGRRSKRRADDE